MKALLLVADGFEDLTAFVLGTQRELGTPERMADPRTAELFDVHADSQLLHRDRLEQNARLSILASRAPPSDGG